MFFKKYLFKTNSLQRGKLMSCIIVNQGQRATKKFNNKPLDVIPFVGADKPGNFAQVGIGYIEIDGGAISFWGLLCPNYLIRSWRAMKLFEKLTYFNQYTLAHCWDIIGSEPSRDAEAYIIQQFTFFANFVEAVTSIQQLVPDDETVHLMLCKLRRNKIYVDTQELIKELSTDFLANSTEIEKLFAHVEREKISYALKQKIINEPVPKKHSLSVFFEELGICNFVIGGGFGAYGLDWGHIEIIELDRIVKQDSQYASCHYLEITEKGPDTHRRCYRFGKLKQPTYVANDGTVYIFERAQWRGDCFKVFTRINEEHKRTSKKRIVSQYVGEFSVVQLRQLLQLNKKRWW
jgi:hypothetical protein